MKQILERLQKEYNIKNLPTVKRVESEKFVVLFLSKLKDITTTDSEIVTISLKGEAFMHVYECPDLHERIVSEFAKCGYVSHADISLSPYDTIRINLQYKTITFC